MIKQDAHRTSRIEARIAPDTLELVRRAAELQGRSLSDFLVTAAQDAAKKTLEETNIIRLSSEEQLRFVELLLNPPAPSAVILKVLEVNQEMFGTE